MVSTKEGSLDGSHLRIGVVVARFNEFITRRLLDGALTTLAERGVRDEDVTVVWVPGAFEVPWAGARLLERDDIDAAVALGAVIRGETAHFEYVSGAAARGTLRVSLDTGKPFAFGVLTVDTLEQAMARSEPGAMNTGSTAALTAIEMARAGSLISGEETS